MTRRSGQTPKLEIKNGQYTFRYRKDIPGVEDRKQVREVIGPVKSMTKSEAERRIKGIMAASGINTADAKIPSVLTFAQTVKHYREVFAPRMLRASTLSIAESHLKTHLEADWNDVPIEHIDIDAVNSWIWKKRKESLSWTTIKNILRTMQRVLSCSSKNNIPPFSQRGLAIPQKDKLQMKIRSRKAISFSWADTTRIAKACEGLADLDDNRKKTYAMAFVLAAATGLRCSELFALRVNDINFKAGTVEVDESVCQRTYTMEPCKNVAAHRIVLLADREGKEALRMLKRFLSGIRVATDFVFHSRRGSPLRETSLVTHGLHPALKAVGLPQAGMHAFRRGCNRRWELAGMNPAVQRQMMGHSSSAMTARYSGEIPLEQVRVVTQCDPKRFVAVA
jgi:integrase